MNPEVRQKIFDQIVKITRKDPMYKASYLADAGGVGGGIANSMMGDSGALTGGLVGGGIGAGTGLKASAWNDINNTINKESARRRSTGMKTVGAKLVRDPKKAALLASLGLVTGGAIGAGFGSLFD